MVVTKLNGAVVDRKDLPAAGQAFQDLCPDRHNATRNRSGMRNRQRAHRHHLDTKTGKKGAGRRPSSIAHHDLGYTDLQAYVEEKQIRNISLGIDLARRTATYPEGARFVWNLEVLWGADLWMQRKTEAEKTAFVQAVTKGWIALNGMYANELTGLG